MPSQKGILSTPQEEKCKVDHKPLWEDKLVSLRAQRKARGECFKCGDKFQPGHKCAKTVPLNVVEELLEIIQHTSDSESEQEEDSSSDESLMALSYCATAGLTNKKSMRLVATIVTSQVFVSNFEKNIFCLY
jgi:hypothetical protein